jgi:malate dehydrogenase
VRLLVHGFFPLAPSLPHSLTPLPHFILNILIMFASRSIAKTFNTAVRNYRVGVVGASGGIGQPLSLLLKLDQRVTDLSLYDVAPVTPGVAADIGHVCTPAKTAGYVGQDQMHAALKDCDVVVIPAGVPRKPGMTRDDLFTMNASIVQVRD